MPKFHEEFFRKTTSEHDQLVSWAFSNPMEIWNILKQKNFVNNFINSEIYKIYNVDEAQEIFICNSNGPYCSNKGNVASVKTYECSECKYFQKEMFSFYGLGEILIKNEKIFTEEVSDKGIIYSSKQYDLIFNFDNSLISVQIIPNQIKITRPLEITQNINIDRIEIEEILKTNNFIIGYADLVFTLSLSFSTSIKIKRDWVWNNYLRKEKCPEKIIIIIEAKPNLISWGGPLRQLKTYMDLKRNEGYVFGVLLTYNQNFSQEHEKILEKENIVVITLPKPQNNLYKKLEGY